jgi:hypothetical protein
MALRITGSVIGEPITSSSSSATGMWTSQEVAALQQDGIWQIAPTFTLTPSAATVNEGASITITLTTTGIPNGAVVPYVITGANINSNDSNLTGNFVIQNGSNTISFAANADLTLEGAETLTITAGGTSANVTINDTSNGADAQFLNTTLLLHGDGTNNSQNNTFLDSSTNNFSITRNGNATQGTFTPFGSTWSNFFNASTNYSLYMNGQSAFDFGTGDFTIEVWLNPASVHTPIIYDSRSGNNGPYVCIYLLSNVPYYYANTGDRIVGSTALTPGVWYHLAVSRVSGNTRMFINGTQVGSTYVDSTNYSSGGANRPIIGESGYSSGDAVYYGHMSNLRIIKGQGLYSGTFIPATSNLTTTSVGSTGAGAAASITGTVSLLTLNSNRVIDSSTNNFTISTISLYSVQKFSPFSTLSLYSPSIYGGSAYLDGTGDYLELPPNSANFLHTCTAPWTIESWFYTGSTSTQAIFSTDADSVSVGINISLSNTVSRNIDVQIFRGSSGNFYRFYTGAAWNVNAWNHFAVTYNGSTFSIYVNGVSQSLTISGTATFSASNATYYPAIGVYKSGSGLGNYVTGWISNLRLVNGSAVYTSAFTPPTAPVTAISGTSLLCNFTNAGIYDNAMMTTLETVADAKVSTTQSKFGGSSMYFDGTGDYLTSSSASNSGFAFGTGDFTIEMWVNPADVSGSAQRGFLQTSDTAGGLKTTYTSGVIMLFGINGSVASLTGGVGVNIAGTWIGSSTAVVTTNAWYHIALVRSSGVATIYVNGTSVGSASATGTCYGTYLCVGGYYSTSYLLNGYMDDVRITKGYARYTSNFTPPSLAFSDR